MAKETRKGFDIGDLSSLIRLMIAGSEKELDDKNHTEDTKQFLKKWHLRGHQLFTDQQVKKKRERITIDVKECRAGSEKVWVWVAVDLKDEMVIAIHVSAAKNQATTYDFLKDVAGLCRGKLPRVYVNERTFSPQEFEKLGFRYTPLDFGAGSVTETFLSIVDTRMCAFLNRVTPGKTPKNIRWWIEGFAAFTNYWTARR